MPGPFLSIAAVATGGEVGATVRYLTTIVGTGCSTRFPVGTAVVNLAGCLARRVFWWGLLEKEPPAFAHRAVGSLHRLLGRLTTFSAFSVETFSFIRDGSWGSAIPHITLNAVLGIVLVVAGVSLGSTI